MIRKNIIRPRRGYPRTLKSLISEYSFTIPLKAKLISRLRAEWSAIVGNNIARHSQPHEVQGGRLVIFVDDPVWIHELSLLKDDFLHKIHARLKNQAERNMIESLKFYNGALEPLPEHKDEGFTLPQPDAETRKRIQATVKPIQDKDLREAMVHYLTFSAMIQKEEKQERKDGDLQ